MAWDLESLGAFGALAAQLVGEGRVLLLSLCTSKSRVSKILSSVPNNGKTHSMCITNNRQTHSICKLRFAGDLESLGAFRALAAQLVR